MTRLWAATHHEEAADVEEGVPGSREGRKGDGPSRTKSCGFPWATRRSGTPTRLRLRRPGRRLALSTSTTVSSSSIEPGSADASGEPATHSHTQREESVMLRSLSKSLLLRGLLAIVVGIIALAWPGVTVGAVVVIFAISVFFDGRRPGRPRLLQRKGGPSRWPSAARPPRHRRRCRRHRLAGHHRPGAHDLDRRVGRRHRHRGVRHGICGTGDRRRARPVRLRRAALGGPRDRSVRPPRRGGPFAGTGLRAVQPRLGDLEHRARRLGARHAIALSKAPSDRGADGDQRITPIGTHHERSTT